jgi:hypothetical protein
LHETFEVVPADVKGVLIYSRYVQACAEANVKPQSSTFIGKLVSNVFPCAKARKQRTSTDWLKFERTYMGLKYRADDVSKQNDDDLSIISQHLLPDMCVLEQVPEYILIAYRTPYICQGNRITIETNITRDKTIAVTVQSKCVVLSDYGIWPSLPDFSPTKIKTLFRCVTSLKLCRGIEASDNDSLLPSTATVFWASTATPDSSSKRRQSSKCSGALSLIAHGTVCSECKKLQVIYKKKTDKIVTPCDFTTPPRTKVSCDVSVGTTPLRSPTDVMLKYFPHLTMHEKLLCNISQQVKLAEKHPKGRRYEKDLISLALTLWTRSPRNYEELLKSGFIFPSTNTLSLYKNCIKQKPGFNSDMFRWMAKEADRITLSKAGYMGGLILDEMNIQKDLQIVSKQGEWGLVGLADLGEGSNAISSLLHKDTDLVIADHVLQFLFHGMTGFRMPFACFPTSQANASQLYLNIWRAVSLLADWGFQVTYLSLDGSSNNRALIKMMFPGNPLDQNMALKNRCNPVQEIVVLPDSSHLMKKIRNAVFSSGVDEKHTRLLRIGGNTVTWQHWEDA